MGAITSNSDNVRFLPYMNHVIGTVRVKNPQASMARRIADSVIDNLNSIKDFFARLTGSKNALDQFQMRTQLHTFVNHPTTETLNSVMHTFSARVRALETGNAIKNVLNSTKVSNNPQLCASLSEQQLFDLFIFTLSTLSHARKKPLPPLTDKQVEQLKNAHLNPQATTAPASFISAHRNKLYPCMWGLFTLTLSALTYAYGRSDDLRVESYTGSIPIVMDIPQDSILAPFLYFSEDYYMQMENNTTTPDTLFRIQASSEEIVRYLVHVMAHYIADMSFETDSMSYRARNYGITPHKGPLFFLHSTVAKQIVDSLNNKSPEEVNEYLNSLPNEPNQTSPPIFEILLHRIINIIQQHQNHNSIPATPSLENPVFEAILDCIRALLPTMTGDRLIHHLHQIADPKKIFNKRPELQIYAK